MIVVFLIVRKYPIVTLGYYITVVQDFVISLFIIHPF